MDKATETQETERQNKNEGTTSLLNFLKHRKQVFIESGIVKNRLYHWNSLENIISRRSKRDYKSGL